MLFVVVSSFSSFVILLWIALVFTLKEVSVILRLNVEMLSSALCIALNVYNRSIPFFAQHIFPYLFNIEFFFVQVTKG